MGAYGLAVAAAFAVALAVLLSVSSTPAANAATVTLTGTTVDAEPGDTVNIPGPATVGAGASLIIDFTITGGTASGSFDVGGGQTVSCSDSTTGKGCDTEEDANSIAVKMTVDDDSADGYIIVRRTQILPVVTTDPTSVVITVTTQPKPNSLTAKAAQTTIAAAAGTTEITATVKNNKSPAVGMNDQRLTFVTTLGTMDCPASGSGDTSINLAENVQWCQVWTSGDVAGTSPAVPLGAAVVTLTGGGREGTATLTISHATLDPASVDVTLFGTAKNLAAKADQNSVEQGGSVFVILTVTDAVGNPVSNAQPGPGETEVVGPDVDDAVDVNTSTIETVATTGDSPYNVNKDVDGDGAVDKGKDVPACGPLTLVEAEDGPPVVQGVFASTGTNQAGQCAVQVNAPADVDGTSADEAATRGEHTINFLLDELEASVTIEVAGVPASIESDAPAYVEPLEPTTITVTVYDDEGVKVGITEVTVRAIEGGGLIEGAGAGNKEDTVDGQSSFTFFAPSTGTATLRIDAGKQKLIVSLPVGAPVEEPPPPPPSLSPAPSASGFTLVTFSGGSVEELGTTVTTSCGGGGTAYATDYQGNWVSFIPAAMIPAVNASFGALFSDGVPAGTPLLIGNCGG
jgi:hypothetical protein